MTRIKKLLEKMGKVNEDHFEIGQTVKCQGDKIGIVDSIDNPGTPEEIYNVKLEDGSILSCKPEEIILEKCKDK
jgi:hypothetical protein